MADFEVPPLEHSPWPTPSRAIYGFVLYVATYIMFGMYIIWALFPDSWLNSVGITYLPARHWVITFPFLMWFGVVVIVVVYSTMYLTAIADPEDMRTIKDTFSRVNSDLDDENDEENPERIPPIADVEIYQLDQIYEKSKQK